MKRLHYYIFAVMFLTIIAAWWFGFNGNHPAKEPAIYWILFGFYWLLGILVSVAGVFVLRRFIKIDYKKLTGQDLRAIIFGFLIVSLFIGFVALFFNLFNIPAPLNKPSPATSDQVAFTFGAIIVLCAIGGVLYIIYRIVEASRYRRIIFNATIHERRHKFFLIAKLALTGAVIIFITMLIPDTEFGHMTQLALRMGKWNSEESSVIRWFELKNEGISHRMYLKSLYEICKHLHDGGAKVVIAPLPADLACSQTHVELIKKIAQFGNVVFAVSPNERDEHDLLVQYPLDHVINIDWGVVSAVPLPLPWLQAEKYYPLSYRESTSDSCIPDVAIQAAKRFWGITNNSEMNITGRTFSLGKYRTGLLKDHGVLINYRIHPGDNQTACFYALVNDRTDSIKFGLYGKGIQPVSNPLDSLWKLFNGKIVFISGGIITKIPFIWNYGNIIHAILQNEGTIPLDSWTPFITGVSLIITLCLLIHLKPWLSLSSVIGIVVGQGFLYSWLVSKFDVVVEVLPPIIGTVLGLFAFSFVLVAHERKQMDRDEKKRIIEELQTAHDMQMGLMPANDPTVPGFDISGLCRPAFEVGGDYYDYIWLDEGKTKFGIAIADVSGKAMKAAMTAVMTSGMVYREISSHESPRSILKRINRPMYLKTDRHIFTAMSFAVIDINEKKLSFSNAGQMTPLLRRGEVLHSIKVEGPRLPLGVMAEVDYNEVSVQLQTGDILFLFTDGIVEAKNNKEELWGFERMEEAVKNLSQTMNAKEMGEALVAKANRFAGSAKQYDDMTVVVVKVL